MTNQNLKKRATSLALFCFTLFSIQAQVSVNIGARAGINLSNVSIDYAIDTLNNTALKSAAISVVAELRIGNKFSIQTELSFLNKGDNIDETVDLDFGGLGSGSIIILREEKMQYLEVPLLFKWDLVAESSADVQLYAGPNFGFLQSREIIGSISSSFTDSDGKTETETRSLNEITNLDSDPNIDTSEIGLAIGAAGRIKAGPGMLSLDLRLGTGLTPYLEGTDDQGQAIKNVNKNTAISLGYLLSFGG